VISQPVWIYQGDSFIAALPSPETRFTYGIDFDLPAIGNQWYSWSPKTDNFANSIAPARTFGLSYQIDQLREAGLIKGGTLDNALVCSETGWLNPPLRFTNEPVRHKMLDLIGDLSLLGSFPQAHYLAYKASHKLHIQLAQKILEL
jgi:UDP-3-O-[3-hydroxymyristoyl] N-acetylglucosamine deacetylase